MKPLYNKILVASASILFPMLVNSTVVAFSNTDTQIKVLPSHDRNLPQAPPSATGYIWPTYGVVTSGFGQRFEKLHAGIDIANAMGTPIWAAASGVVVSAGWSTLGYGNLVTIQHSDGSLSLYGHNSRILVRKGEQVQQGQQIAEMGSTGNSTGPHLHFEIHPQGKEAVNPRAFLPSQQPQAVVRK